MSSTWAAILLAGGGTFAMRASFLLAARKLSNIPEGFHRMLRQIPPAALAAIVVPSFLRPDGNFDLWQPELAAGAVATLVGWKTRNIAATLAAGMGLLFVLREIA